jgi:hypothetical protein
MRNNKFITDGYVGMRIKIALPTSWCQVHSDSPMQWLKGKITKIPINRGTGKPCNNTIIVSVWSKKVGRLKNMLCFKQEDGTYDHIIKQK